MQMHPGQDQRESGVEISVRFGYGARGPARHDWKRVIVRMAQVWSRWTWVANRVGHFRRRRLSHTLEPIEVLQFSLKVSGRTAIPTAHVNPARRGFGSSLTVEPSTTITLVEGFVAAKWAPRVAGTEAKTATQLRTATSSRVSLRRSSKHSIRFPDAVWAICELNTEHLSMNTASGYDDHRWQIPRQSIAANSRCNPVISERKHVRRLAKPLQLQWFIFWPASVRPSIIERISIHRHTHRGSVACARRRHPLVLVGFESSTPFLPFDRECGIQAWSSLLVRIRAVLSQLLSGRPHVLYRFEENLLKPVWRANGLHNGFSEDRVSRGAEP